MIRQKLSRSATPVAVALVGVASVMAQPEQGHFNLSDDHGGFRPLPASIGAPVDISLAEDPTRANEIALRAAYDIERDRLAGLMRPVNGLQGEGLRFRYQTDAAGVFVVGVTEQDGSMYQTIVTAEADTWAVLELGFDELRLSEDSSDENDTLDLAEVNAIIFADPSGFLPSAPKARALLLGEAGVMKGRPHPSNVAAQGYDFGSGTDGWKPLPPPAGAPVEVAIDTPEGHTAGGTLLLSYVLESNKLSAIVRNVDGASGRGIRIRIRSEGATLVVLGLVERDGSMYQRVFQTGGNGWEVFEAGYESFALSDDSSDEDSALALRDIGTLVLADPGGFMGAAEESRKLWLDSFEHVAKSQ